VVKAKAEDDVVCEDSQDLFRTIRVVLNVKGGCLKRRRGRSVIDSDTGGASSLVDGGFEKPAVTSFCGMTVPMAERPAMAAISAMANCREDSDRTSFLHAIFALSPCEITAVL
jgi:hypothetical protein